MTGGPPPAVDEAGLPGLAARLWADVVALLRAEIALAGTEARQAVRGVAFGLAALGLGLVLALAAVVALSGAAVAALVGAGLSPALAGLAVAAGTLTLAALCLWWGLSRLSRAAGMPARAVQSLQRDMETLATLVDRNA